MRARYSGDLAGGGTGGGWYGWAERRRVFSVSLHGGLVFVCLRRRERAMMVVWEIGAPGEVGRGVSQAGRVETVDSGREEMAERILGVVVRRTIFTCSLLRAVGDRRKTREEIKVWRSAASKVRFAALCLSLVSPTRSPRFRLT